MDDVRLADLKASTEVSKAGVAGDETGPVGTAGVSAVRLGVWVGFGEKLGDDGMFGKQIVGLGLFS